MYTICYFYVDELVCFNHVCENDVCQTLYEVCSENSQYNVTKDHNICWTAFIVNVTTNDYSLTQHCFPDPNSNCTKECVLEQHSLFNGDTALVDCCCTESLCNNVTLDFSGLCCVYAMHVCVCVCVYSCVCMCVHVCVCLTGIFSLKIL